MSRSIARRRHCRHRSFERFARRTGYGAGLDQSFTGTGNGVLDGIAVAPEAPMEMWTMTFTDATNFTVTGTTSGAQAAGVVGTRYASDGGEVGFLITAGGTPFVASDAFFFFTEVLPGFQAELNTGDGLRYHRDAAQRINPTVDGVEELHDALRLEQGDEDDVGDRSHQYTFEDVDAASAPGDIGLT